MRTPYDGILALLTVNAGGLLGQMLADALRWNPWGLICAVVFFSGGVLWLGVRFRREWRRVQGIRRTLGIK